LPDAVVTSDVAGETISGKLTRASGSNVPIGGLKVVTANGWIAARPSRTETPGSLSAPTKPSEHRPKGGPAQECESGLVETFPILGYSSTSTEPGDGAFDQPALWQHDELASIGAFDDLHVDLPANQTQTLRRRC